MFDGASAPAPAEAEQTANERTEKKEQLLAPHPYAWPKDNSILCWCTTARASAQRWARAQRLDRTQSTL